MSDMRETFLRTTLIVMCVLSGVAESITLSYFVLIQLGYWAFSLFVAAIFHFSIMDSFNILWNGSQHAYAVLRGWLHEPLWMKRLFTAVAFVWGLYFCPLLFCSNLFSCAIVHFYVLSSISFLLSFGSWGSSCLDYLDQRCECPCKCFALSK